jgi:hypothetical protein
MWTLDEETFVVPHQSMLTQVRFMLNSHGSHICIFAFAILGVLGAVYTKASMLARSDTCGKLDAVFV